MSISINKPKCPCKKKSYVSESDVMWCYETFLGREPENYQAVRQHIKSACCWKRLVYNFKISEEFLGKKFVYNKGDISNDLFYFYHIYKTGGTSVHKYLQKVVDEDTLFPGINMSDINRANGFGRYKYISGHFGDIPISNRIRSSIKIATLFRDPLGRGISHYNHEKRDSSGLWHKEINSMSLNEFLHEENADTVFGNVQCLHLCDLNPKAKKRIPGERKKMTKSEVLELALESLNSLDVFGIMEKHHDFLINLCKKWLLPIPETDIKLNIAPEKDKKIIAQNDISLINELCHQDTLLYKEVCSKLGYKDIGH